MYVAGYGPKALGVAGRVGDGVVIQLADPDIVEWIMSIARRAAEEAGRDPAALQPIVCAPAFIGDDLAARARAGALVPGDGLEPRHGSAAEVPGVASCRPRSTSTSSAATFYDYKDHSRVGAKHGEFVDDETCDRFCVLGTAEDHIAKLQQLEAIGVAHWNIYLMTEGQEQILETYGEQVMPALRTGALAGTIEAASSPKRR